MIPSEPQRLLIIGAANAEIAKLIRAVNRVSRRYEPLGYLDDDHTRWGETFMGLEVVGPVIQLLTPNHADNVAVVSIGSPVARRGVVERLGSAASRLISLVHPDVDLWEVTLGHGVMVFDQAIVSPHVVVGDHTVVSFRTVLGHDTQVGSFCMIGPGAIVGGRSRIGNGVYVGAGAILVPNVEIGAGATVGAGAVVTRDVPPSATIIGNPGRILRAEATSEKVVPIGETCV